VWRVVLVVYLGAYVASAAFAGKDKGYTDAVVICNMIIAPITGYFAARAFGRRAWAWLLWHLLLCPFAAARLAWVGPARRGDTDRLREINESGVDLFAWFGPWYWMLILTRPRVYVAGKGYALRFFHPGFIPLSPGEHEMTVWFYWPIYGHMGWATMAAIVPPGGVASIRYHPNLLWPGLAPSIAACASSEQRWRIPRAVLWTVVILVLSLVAAAIASTSLREDVAPVAPVPVPSERGR
jgi:hypothetical protein